VLGKADEALRCAVADADVVIAEKGQGDVDRLFLQTAVAVKRASGKRKRVKQNQHHDS
jgi:hypothetical protein